MLPIVRKSPVGQGGTLKVRLHGNLSGSDVRFYFSGGANRVF